MRQRLEDLVARAEADVEALERQHRELVAASVGANADDEHDPEGATIAFERQQLQALLTRARTAREDAERALERLADDQYGRCERCGQPIAAERLEARPAASSCITCASKH